MLNVQRWYPCTTRIWEELIGSIKNIHAQRISFRGKKWWFLLFAFGIDASRQNAWDLYKNISGKKSNIANIDAKLFNTI